MELSGNRTLIVVPALNEAKVIQKVISEIQSYVPNMDCLVVDDGSTDNTAEVAANSGAKVISLAFNLGVGGAMRTGFLYAKHFGYQNVIQVDADGQHDPKDIEKLVEGLNSADLIIGARFAGIGNYVVSGPRKWAMNFLSHTLSKVCGTELTDTTSGFRASGPKAIELFARHYPAEYLGDTVESLVLASQAGLIIKQIPVEMRERSGGNPSQGPIKSALFLARVGLAVIFVFLRPKKLNQ